MSYLKILTDDRNSVPYRPALAKALGSVTAAILLQQIAYWNEKMGGKFYKFIAPAKKHAKYAPGESWQEELAFSRREFSGALAVIGQKIKKGVSKKAVLEGVNNKSLVAYWTDRNHVTWYELNVPLFEALLHSIYDGRNVHYLSNGRNVQQREKSRNVQQMIPETTPKKKDEREGAGAPAVFFTLIEEVTHYSPEVFKTIAGPKRLNELRSTGAMKFYAENPDCLRSVWNIAEDEAKRNPVAYFAKALIIHIDSQKRSSEYQRKRRQQQGIAMFGK